MHYKFFSNSPLPRKSLNSLLSRRHKILFCLALLSLTTHSTPTNLSSLQSPEHATLPTPVVANIPSPVQIFYLSPPNWAYSLKIVIFIWKPSLKPTLHSPELASPHLLNPIIIELVTCIERLLVYLSLD